MLWPRFAACQGGPSSFPGIEVRVLQDRIESWVKRACGHGAGRLFNNGGNGGDNSSTASGDHPLKVIQQVVSIAGG